MTDSDLGDAYVDGVARIVKFGTNDAAADVRVRACPAWTVREVIAHMTVWSMTDMLMATATRSDADGRAASARRDSPLRLGRAVGERAEAAEVFGECCRAIAMSRNHPCVDHVEDLRHADHIEALLDASTAFGG